MEKYFNGFELNCFQTLKLGRMPVFRRRVGLIQFTNAQNMRLNNEISFCFSITTVSKRGTLFSPEFSRYFLLRSKRALFRVKERELLLRSLSCFEV